MKEKGLEVEMRIYRVRVLGGFERKGARNVSLRWARVFCSCLNVGYELDRTLSC